jgi:hypothetical protein
MDGVSLYVIQKLLGHTTASVTQDAGCLNIPPRIDFFLAENPALNRTSFGVSLRGGMFVGKTLHENFLFSYKLVGKILHEDQTFRN